MRKTIFLLVIFSQTTWSQTLELIEAGDTYPFGEISLIDTNLYRAGLVQEVASIDIGNPSYPITIVANGSNTATSFLRSTVDAQEQNVYLANVDGQIFTAPIVNGNISSLTPLINENVQAIGLAIADNTLYFVTLSSQVLSLDVTDPNNTLAVVYDPPNALPMFNIHLEGDFLYYSTRDSFNPNPDWQIFRLNITESNPQPQLVTTTTNRTWTLTTVGDFLYLGSDENDKISRINTTASLPTNEETVFSSLPLENNDSLFSIAHDGSFLYLSSETGIYRVEDQVLSQEYYYSNSSVYPNPARDVINFDFNNHNVKSYSIYNTYGAKVTQGALGRFQNSISIANLKSGTYILNLYSDNKKQTLKVIKN